MKNRLIAMTLVIVLLLFGAFTLMHAGGGQTAETFSSATLKVGSSGKDVYELQGRLKHLGFFNGKVDGQFGASTKKCGHLVSMEVRDEIRWCRRIKNEAKAVGSNEKLEAYSSGFSVSRSVQLMNAGKQAGSAITPISPNHLSLGYPLTSLS